VRHPPGTTRTALAARFARHPVVAGGAVWIGAFCPHWFCALGSTPLRYLLLEQPAADG
jgi:glyoxylate utilization-related uncharacterized protein